MKTVLEYIQESVAQHSHKVSLPDSFIDTLDALIMDWDKKFNAYWSLQFLFNIIGEACGKNPKVIKTAYDENGKRKDKETHLFAINNKKCNQLRAEEDHNGQIKWYDTDKYLKTFGTGYTNEADFGLGIIEALQKSDNFKLKEYKYSASQLQKDFKISIKKHPELDYNITMYYINDWRVVTGYMFKKGDSPSLRNDIRFDFVIPNSTEYKPLYRCDGAGLHGSEDHYTGDDEDKFQITIYNIMQKHLHIK